MAANCLINEFLGPSFLNRIRPWWGVRGFGFGPFRIIRIMISLAILGIIGLFSLPIIWREQGVPEEVINQWILIGWIIFVGALAIIGVIILGVRSKKKREAAQSETVIMPPLSTPEIPPSTPESSIFSRVEGKEGIPPVSRMEEKAVRAKYCIHCGKEIVEGSQFCIHCGEKQ